ncbi:MAG: TSUP family transporter, partial [Oscillospiraceae bacterium]|nr:TSUP family transporter [Oscillospiraceae bacterium]
MNYELLKLAVTGALAGAANGFLGAGGGLIAVPLLAGWIGVERRKAFATSLALMLPLSAVS